MSGREYLVSSAANHFMLFMAFTSLRVNAIAPGYIQTAMTDAMNAVTDTMYMANV